jgi:hypothetical protein
VVPSYRIVGLHVEGLDEGSEDGSALGGDERIDGRQQAELHLRVGTTRVH